MTALPSRRPIRLLHCSDLHLDYRGFEQAAVVLAGIGATVRETRARVLVISGDLFDSARQSPAFVGDVADSLCSTGIPIVAVRGNHEVVYGQSDPLGDLFSLLTPEGNLLLDDDDGETALVADASLRVWGRSMREHSPANDPLKGLPRMPADGSWNIAIAHGDVVRAPGAISSPICLERYREALSPCHYVALGHQHYPGARLFGSTVVTYSGSASRWCGTGTAAVVTLHPDEGIAVMTTEVHRCHAD